MAMSVLGKCILPIFFPLSPGAKIKLSLPGELGSNKHIINSLWISGSSLNEGNGLDNDL